MSRVKDNHRMPDAAFQPCQGDRSTQHRGSVRRLAALLEASQAARPVFLLGAGASFRSGVPLAAEAVNRIAREAFAARELGTNTTSKVMPGDVARFLSEQPWFIPGPDRLADNFPSAVRHLLVPREYRREFFSREMRAVNGTSAGYRSLARLAQRGLWRVALTTNFDGCIVDALNDLSPHLPRPVEINSVPQDHTAFNLFSRSPQVVYLHGAIDSYTDLNTESETTSLPLELVALLKQLIGSSPLVVVGYRGGEASIMEGLFGSLHESTGSFRCGVYWCDLGRAAVHPRVQALQERLGGNFIPLKVDGFDELIADLDEVLAAQDVYRPPKTADAGGSFDLPGNASLTDLDDDLILSKLAEYCERVGRPPVDRDRMWGLLGELELVETDAHGVLVPTAEGVLLFGKDVQRAVPQACVDLTFAGKKRQLIKGNLIEQFASLRRILEDPAVNPDLRIKTSTSSVRRTAYNTRSVIEMVVNMLVHRDYSVAEASRIDIDEGKLIRFTNPGGLSDTVLKRVSPNDSGEFVPVRSLTEIRNRSLADVFYGIGPMDKRGSGLCDARDLMVEQGGGTRYAVEEKNSYFVAELLQARQKAPGDSDTAVALHPFGVYITNHLRFEVLPASVTVVDQASAPRVSVANGKDLFGEGESQGAPLLLRQKDRVVSFCKPADLGARSGTYKQLDIEHFRQQRGGHSTLSHLLREHFVGHLRTFQGDGLFVETGGHRAYFIKQGDDAVKIKYDGAKRTGIEREMVKRRELRSETYHENEGIAFDIVRFQGRWAAQIKPFYMFTGADGRTPLSPYRRGRLATSRMRFDRNPNVASDLAFWARYLSRGSAAVQLCRAGGYDLLLSGAFHEVEIANPSPEEVA